MGNGPMPRPPPNHPIMMEMQALDKHLRGLYQQPQNPDTQQQIKECQERMRHLQNTLAQQFGPPPGMMGPGGPGMMGPGGPPGPDMGPPAQDPYEEDFDDEEIVGKKKRRSSKPKEPKPPKEPKTPKE